MQMSPKTVNYGGKNLAFGDRRFLQKNLGFGVGFGYRNNTNVHQCTVFLKEKCNLLCI